MKTQKIKLTFWEKVAVAVGTVIVATIGCTCVIMVLFSVYQVFDAIINI